MIELMGVDKFYWKIKNGKREKIFALKNVNISFRKNNITAVFGNSGSGKTTLGNIITGFNSPDSGEVLYDGNPERNQKTVRYVFQDPYISLNPAKNVEWHVETAARLNGIDAAGIRETVELVGLPWKEYGTKNVGVLSGGEKQRLSYAMAIAQEPDYVVMDEPFSYLDSLNIFNLLHIMRDIKEKTAFIYLDHDLNRCLFVSDFICVLKNGSIIETGTPEKIKNEPVGSFTKEAVSKLPDIKKRI